LSFQEFALYGDLALCLRDRANERLATEKGDVEREQERLDGIIHDWEFAFQGESSEDVRENVATGAFGMWRETGYYINLALAVGAFCGLGYGESVGKFIAEESLDVPTDEKLVNIKDSTLDNPDACDRAAAAVDLLGLKKRLSLEAGKVELKHPWKNYSIQKAAWEQNIPFTAHPMFGHDIIYTNPMNHGASVGRVAEQDFLRFARTISNIDNGVYLSVGSAVMSPMVFEKSFSMAQNLAWQAGRRICNHTIVVVDLEKSRWDWNKGEPPTNQPEYYLRYCKTFSRMGGDMHYASADNRDFLLAMLQNLS